MLHAFTHAFATMFGPLYLLMRDDLGLSAVSKVTLLVTLYGVVYWLMAFPAGYLADHFDRKNLLGIGLLGNALCILGMGLTQSYGLILVLSLVAGLFGSLFHPCANALVPAHYPRAPGMAIGLLGIGSGVGFFAGPFYAGWSAQHSRFGGEWLADWQRPFVELGLLGVVCAVVYLLVAREADSGRHAPTFRPGLSWSLRWRTLAHAGATALREYTSVGSATLSALFLLKAYGYDPQRTGQVLGMAMLAAAVVNPVVVYLTGGVRRIPAHIAILLMAAGVTAVVPVCPEGWVLPVLIVLMTLLLASSAVGDAGLTERVDPQFRGRVNGLFLTVVGGTAATSPFAVGFAVDVLGERASNPMAYVPLYLALAGLVLAGTVSAWTMTRLAMPECGAKERKSEGGGAVDTGAVIADTVG